MITNSKRKNGWTITTHNVHVHVQWALIRITPSHVPPHLRPGQSTSSSPHPKQSIYKETEDIHHTPGSPRLGTLSNIASYTV